MFYLLNAPVICFPVGHPRARWGKCGEFTLIIQDKNAPQEGGLADYTPPQSSVTVPGANYKILQPLGIVGSMISVQIIDPGE